MKKTLRIMIATLLTLVLAFTVVSCGETDNDDKKSSSDSIVGKWVVSDIETDMATVNVEKNVYEFTADGKYIITNQYGSLEAEYKIDGNKITVISEDDVSEGTFILEGDTLEIDADGAVVSLKRK